MANAVDRYRCWWKKPCLGFMTKWKPLSSVFEPLSRRKDITLLSAEGKIMERNIICKAPHQRQERACIFHANSFHNIFHSAPQREFNNAMSPLFSVQDGRLGSMGILAVSIALRFISVSALA